MNEITQISAGQLAKTRKELMKEGFVLRDTQSFLENAYDKVRGSEYAEVLHSGNKYFTYVI